MRSDAGHGVCVEGWGRKAGDSVDGGATESDAATRGGGGVMDAAGEATDCWRRGSRRVCGSMLILGLVTTACMVRGAGAWGMPTVCSLGNDVAAPQQRSSGSCPGGGTALCGVAEGGVGVGLLARRGVLCLRVGTAGPIGASGGKRCGRLAMSGEIVGRGGGEELGGQGGGDGRVPRRGWGAALGNRIRGMKVLTPFFKVAFVIAAAFRRLFMIRIAWLSMVGSLSFSLSLTPSRPLPPLLPHILSDFFQRSFPNPQDPDPLPEKHPYSEPPLSLPCRHWHPPADTDRRRDMVTHTNTTLLLLTHCDNDAFAGHDDDEGYDAGHANSTGR